ncbi:beta-N-acetylglucosaminidase domain-containing protein, partial [Olsenella sp. An290]|uniref:beta-N-acetylglucosaminidase domain-containing protein n=1 Tax=Olsenella sp. An290 TaxID=1965625 RepID=UPI000B55E107
GADVEPGTLLGCVINPMQQSEPSKVGIFMNADFSWNNWTSYDHADRAWRDAFSHVDNGSPVATGASDALRELSEHMKWYQGGGVTFESRESEAAKPMLDELVSKLNSGSVTVEDLSEAKAFFDNLADAVDTYDTSADNDAMREQIDPWIKFWQDTTHAAQYYLAAAEGALTGDTTALVSGYTQGREAYDNAKDHSFDYVGTTMYARAGTRAVQPAVDALNDYVSAQAGGIVGGTESVARVSSEGLSVYESYSLDRIIDGNTATQAWLTGTRDDQGIDVGNSFTVTYAPARTVEEITLIQDSNDKLAGGVIEYTVEGGTDWVEAGAVSSATTTIELDQPTKVSAIRVRCTTGAKQWWQVYELIAGEKNTDTPEQPEYTATVEAIGIQPYEGQLSNIADGNSSSQYWCKGREGGNIMEGDGFQVNYEPYALVGEVTFSQGDGDVITHGTLEYTVDGERWVTAGSIDSSAEQTLTFPRQKVKAIRVTSDENTAKWWKIRELSVGLGEENPAGSIVSTIENVDATGSSVQGIASITGGEVAFAAGDYVAVDLGSLKGDVAADASALSLPAGFEVVTSTNGLAWTAGESSSAARYVGIRYTGEGTATLDLSAGLAITYNDAANADFTASSTADGTSTDAMLDGDITTYWRGGAESGTLVYTVSNPLDGTTPRDTLRVISWGTPSGAALTARIYTDAEHTQVQEIQVGTLDESVMSFSLAEAAEAAGVAFCGVESVEVAWNGAVPSIAEVGMLDATTTPDPEPEPGEGDYTIYPTPHALSYAEGEVDFEGTVNTIVGDGIDSATEARLDEALELAGVEGTPADATSDDGEGLEVLVGIEGSGDAADAYVDALEAADAVTVEKDLFTKTDSYFLGVIPAEGDAPDRIVVLGRDTDSAFYGLTTLYQVLQQDADGAVDALQVSDWADVETRGFIEGYYGNPWSTEDRCELMRWGGHYKLNAYVYAPKDDPKHNAQWRELYTPEELEDIKALADAGNASKVRFIYALHPFMNDPIGFGSTYEQDLADLKAKYLQVIEAGCRQIMVSADDAADPGSSNYVRLLNDLTDWIHGLQEEKNEDGTPKYEGLKDVIPFVAANYAAAGESWYNQLPDNVRPITTGKQVWGKADQSTISTFTSKSNGVKPFMWINWPCTDNTRDHLSMGGYENALGADVEPGTLLGCVINPMQQSEPSKVGIFMNADFSWN